MLLKNFMSIGKITKGIKQMLPFKKVAGYDIEFFLIYLPSSSVAPDGYHKTHKPAQSLSTKRKENESSKSVPLTMLAGIARPIEESVKPKATYQSPLDSFVLLRTGKVKIASETPIIRGKKATAVVQPGKLV